MIQRLISRLTRTPQSIVIKEISPNEDMSVSPNLLNPLLITEEFIETYLIDITLRNTYDLQDDLLMIWIALPDNGYGDIKPLVLKLREALITELNSRTPIMSKPRLEYRLKNNGE